MKTYPPSLPRVVGAWSDDFFRTHCFDLWREHLNWLAAEGFAPALQTETDVIVPAPSGHEMVDLLGEFIAHTGLINAHLGLTSSDVCDNVRLMQLACACGHVTAGVIQLIIELPQVLCELLPSGLRTETVGFTHWQPAAPITWGHRVLAWTGPLRYAAEHPPRLHAKQFGGPVGNGASLQRVLKCDALALTERLDHFQWDEFGLNQPANPCPLQSSDHVDELAAVQWLARIAAQLHKLAADWRFLASLDVIKMSDPARIGSSSMPHKANPHHWEKVCGLCRSAATVQQELWDVAAHNSLERTLDTSWQIKHALPRACRCVAEAVDLLRAHLPRVRLFADADLLAKWTPLIDSDQQLTAEVLNGKSRWTAFLEATRQITPTTKSPAQL